MLCTSRLEGPQLAANVVEALLVTTRKTVHVKEEETAQSAKHLSNDPGVKNRNAQPGFMKHNLNETAAGQLVGKLTRMQASFSWVQISGILLRAYTKKKKKKREGERKVDCPATVQNKPYRTSLKKREKRTFARKINHRWARVHLRQPRVSMKKLPISERKQELGLTSATLAVVRFLVDISCQPKVCNR